MATTTSLFSSGKLYIAPTGTAVEAAITGQYQIGDVQDASADLTYNEATTYTDAATSRFPQAVGYHQGKATLKLTVRDFNPLLFTAMQNVAGTLPTATATVSNPVNAGYTTYSFGNSTRPTAFALYFAAQDKDSNVVTVFTMPNATSGGFTATHKLSDFGDVEFTVTGTADPVSGICYAFLTPSS